MRLLLLILVLPLMASCASTQSEKLVSYGNISGENYITANGSIALTAPQNWEWTTEISSKIVSNLASKLKRPREVVLLVNSTDRETFMLVESYKLTWGGKPITPAVLTATISKERIEKSCYLSMKSETSSKFSAHNYKCFTHEKHSECIPAAPCLESSRERISTRSKKIIVYDLVYMIEVPSQKTLSGNEEGWRVSFTLFTPKETSEENKRVLDSVLNSIRLVNN